MTIHEILATVRRVEIRTNRLVNDMMVGAYLSRLWASAAQLVLYVANGRRW